MEYHNNKFLGFTLPEVLITIVIIGVVAAMTLSPLITKIRNKGYAERLIKTYSVLQDATNQIVSEKGDPQTWPWTQYQGSDINNEGNKQILQYYIEKLKIVTTCPVNSGSYIETDCNINCSKYRYLNGDYVTTYHPLYSTNKFILSDGIVLGIGFGQTYRSVAWGMPSLLFTIDVNGKHAPNQIGRDIFYLYLDKNKKGKIQTYAQENGYASVDRFERNNCELNMSGFSCGERIITEGGMNY